MRCLPEIHGARSTWRLPLSEAAARLLVFRQLDPRNADDLIELQEIEDVMLCDPAFALWCLTRRPADAAACSLNWLATWFLEADATAWSAFDQLPSCEHSPKNCRKLAAMSLRAARHRVAKKRQLIHKPKALVAMLHNAAQWFSPSGQLQELPIPEEIRSAIAKANNRRRSTKQPPPLSKKSTRRIRRTWQRRNTDWSDVLAASRQRLGPNDPLQVEKLAAVRQLAYGASHEINNPLANISTRAQTLMRSTDDEALVKHLSAINQQAFRAHEMIADLMFFAKPPALDRAPFRFDELIREIVRQVSQSLPDAETVTIHQQTWPTEVHGDSAQLAMAVKAILQNALEAMRGQGSVWIQIGAINTNGSAAGMQLSIRDNGPGLTADARTHLFDPFFSGREAGRGLGFGLSKAWRIVQLHGGKLLVNSPPDGGTEFVIELPTAPHPAATITTLPPPAS